MRKRLGWVLILAALTVMVAGGLLFWSWRSQASSWESGVLVQFGSTLLLFVPLVVVGRGIERRLDSVGERQEQIAQRQEKTASDVARLAEDVAQTQADLRLTREELSDVVRQRISARRDQDSALFKDVGETPSRENILGSLTRARELDLIPEQGCRISLFGTGLYLRFKPDFQFHDDVLAGDKGPDTIELTLEYTDAEEADHIGWAEEDAASNIALRVAEMMQASGNYPGDTLFDAGKIFEDLAALLSLVHDSATRGVIDSLRHIIQLCPPQWAIGENGICCTERPYFIQASTLKEPHWTSHMNGKTWVNLDSFDDALSTGLALYNAGKLAVKPPGYSEPPL